MKYLEKQSYLQRNIFTIKVKHVIIISIFLFLLFLVVIVFLLKAPDLLVVKSNLAKSDVIFVLGGAVEERLPIAIELIKNAWAEKIIIPGTKPSTARLKFYKIYGDKFRKENIILDAIKQESISKAKVIILKDSKSTFEDIIKLREEYDRNPFKSAIVITEPIHTRRVMLFVGKIFKDRDVKFNVYYPDEYKNYLTIHTEKKDYLLHVLSEYLKIIFYLLFV